MTSDGDQSLPVPLEPAEQALHATARDLGAEVRGRDVLEMVRLVEDQPLVGRQDCGLLPIVRGLPHGEVGGQQVMVDHHDVRLRRPAPRLEQEALIEERALHPGAEVGLGGHFVPDLAGRLDGQVAERAVRRARRPLGERHQFVLPLRLQQALLRARWRAAAGTGRGNFAIP